MQTPSTRPSGTPAFHRARRARLVALASPLTIVAFALAACSGQDAAGPAASDTASPAPSESAPLAANEPLVETPDAQAGSASEAVRAQPSPEPSATATTAPPPPAAKPAPEPAPAPAPVTPVAAAGPPAAFARCAVCHNAEKGAADKLGPNLYGIFGHKMGQGSFAFSEAVKNSGLTMDEATLDAWLENPRALVPGNRMSFPGLKDAGKRQEIIAYLKQQR